MGERPTNRPLGYAGYGQSASARSQVYPGTPTLAVAPSRIDFNPSSRTPSGVTRVTRATCTVTIHRNCVISFFRCASSVITIKFPHNLVLVIFPPLFFCPFCTANMFSLVTPGSPDSLLRPCLRQIGNFRLSLQGTLKR